MNYRAGMHHLRYMLSILDRFLAKSAALLVMLVLLGMVGLAVVQIILRNFFGGGIPGADIILRHLVLWVAMLGGLLATRRNRQINIDVLNRVAGPGLKKVLSWIGSVFTLVVCWFLMRASWVFVHGEKEFGATLVGDFPSWIVQSILPVGFGLIGLQVLLNLALGRWSLSLTGEELAVGENTGAIGEEDRTGGDDGGARA